MLPRITPALSSSKSSRQHLQPFVTARHPLLLLLNSAAATLDGVRKAHARLVVAGLFLYPFPPSKLLEKILLLLSSPSSPRSSSSSPSSTSLLDYAELVFRHSPSPPLFSYNILIKAHSSPSSLLLFRSMLRDPDNPSPNQYTFAFVLASCGPDGLGLGEGEVVRGHAVKRGLDTNVFVSNVLIRMYGSFGHVDDAQRVFDDCSERDLVSWNSLMSGYVGCGHMDRARMLFDEMPVKDVVSWSTVIAGYVQVGCFSEAMELFRDMLQASIRPNEFTLTTVLAACANLVALDQGRWIHMYIEKESIQMNERLLAGLIDMYGKCGELESAWNTFNGKDSSKCTTTRPWNAMLNGLAIHGRSWEAIELFERMKASDIPPDKVTFVSLLSACSHGRLVEQGKHYFDTMKSIYGIDPEIEHYGCMVDLLGRAGLLEEAEKLISTMAMAPDLAIWGALLGACRIHGNIEMGKKIGDLINKLEPTHVGCNVLLANIYSGSRRWDDAKDVRHKIELGGVRKTPGCSSIELDGVFHQFLVGDISQPETKQLYSFLDEMSVKLRLAGYVPEVREVLLDVYEEDKETALTIHSEKLAIAFGLMNTQPGTTIRIVKNLRVCGDCHHATKFISKVYNRKIIVRDRIRFHHFVDGYCSCNDFW